MPSLIRSEQIKAFALRGTTSPPLHGAHQIRRESIISTNLAKNRPACGSWSDDYAIYDFANDDNFGTCWNANPEVEIPWWSVQLGREMPLNMIVITDRDNDRMQCYRLEVEHGGKWQTVFEGDSPTPQRVKIHRFPTLWGAQVRLTVLECKGTASIAEVGVYCEERE